VIDWNTVDNLKRLKTIFSSLNIKEILKHLLVSPKQKWFIIYEQQLWEILTFIHIVCLAQGHLKWQLCIWLSYFIILESINHLIYFNPRQYFILILTRFFLWTWSRWIIQLIHYFESHRENWAFTFLTLNNHFSTHLFNNRLTYTQSQTSPRRIGFLMFLQIPKVNKNTV